MGLSFEDNMIVSATSRQDDEYEYTYITVDFSHEPNDEKYKTINYMTRMKFSSYHVVGYYGDLEYMIFSENEIRMMFKEKAR